MTTPANPYGEPPDDFDEMDPGEEFDLEDECGMGPDGQCSQAGTEWCDWDCPIGTAALVRRKKRPPKGPCLPGMEP